MPVLSYHDVFSPENSKEDFAKLENAVKAANIFVMYWMKKMGLKQFKLTKEEYMRMYDTEDEGIEIRGISGQEVEFRILKQSER